jgi:methionyl-tRNA synthetase
MKYYLTTPIYYVNAAPHIGHTYTTLAADTIKRLKRMQGLRRRAHHRHRRARPEGRALRQADGQTPEEFTTIVSNEFRTQWDRSAFSTTTSSAPPTAKHHETVRWLFKRCLANGYIYKGTYTGQYCVFDELYVNDAKPGDPCPDLRPPHRNRHRRELLLQALGLRRKAAEALRRQSRFHPARIAPQRSDELRARRPAGSFHQPHHDQMGHPARRQARRLRMVRRADQLHQRGARLLPNTDLWPADLHLVGKEILRFHAVFWPAFLMAADLPLPKRIFAHGWLLFENDKMSKSRGNIVRAEPIREVMGIEALRYFLFRESSSGRMAASVTTRWSNRYNSELANGLGNLASRTLTMIRQYRDGVIPATLGRKSSLAAVAARRPSTRRRAPSMLFEFSKASKPSGVHALGRR